MIIKKKDKFSIICKFDDKTYVFKYSIQFWILLGIQSSNLKLSNEKDKREDSLFPEIRMDGPTNMIYSQNDKTIIQLSQKCT